jgi:site-specific DNA recombinase
MTPSHTTRNKVRRYGYYVCTSAQKRGWDTCPSKSIPAGEIEQFVVDQVKCVGRDPALLHEVLAQAHQQDKARRTELETELYSTPAERLSQRRCLGRAGRCTSPASLRPAVTVLACR